VPSDALTSCRSPAARASHNTIEREGHARAGPGAVRCSGRLGRRESRMDLFIDCPVDCGQDIVYQSIQQLEARSGDVP